jgi:hypothetical protein
MRNKPAYTVAACAREQNASNANEKEANQVERFERSLCLRASHRFLGQRPRRSPLGRFSRDFKCTERGMNLELIKMLLASLFMET